MKSVFKVIDLLDSNGFYKIADLFNAELIKIAAFPYNLSNLDELPIDARQVTWEKNKEDYDQYDDVFWDELKQRLPDYRNLPVDPDEKDNMEGKMHGPDNVPGPASVYPEATNISPSMNGNLNDFTWDQARDINQGPDYWKNILPRY
jgi:hypothetical protein